MRETFPVCIRFRAALKAKKKRVAPPARKRRHKDKQKPKRDKRSLVPVEAIQKRCSAVTEEGIRCTRRALPGSRYCWQHAED